MIVYTLLSTYKDKDIVSIVLTSLVIYVIFYSILPAEYNYIIFAVTSVADIYMSKDLFKDRSVIPKASHKKSDSSHHRRHARRGEKHVRFAEEPTYYAPEQPLAPTYDTNSPEYRLWVAEQQQQAQAQAHMQQMQQQQLKPSDTDSNGSTDTSVSISSSELTYSSEDLG